MKCIKVYENIIGINVEINEYIECLNVFDVWDVKNEMVDE